MVRTVQKTIRTTSKSHEKKVPKKWCKKHWKIIKKVIQNRCKNHQKTIKKSTLNQQDTYRHPTERQQKADNLKEGTSERHIQRDQPRPSNTPRAPSGPERMSLPGYPVNCSKRLRVPVGAWVDTGFRNTICQILVAISIFCFILVSIFASPASNFQFIAPNFRLCIDF